MVCWLLFVFVRCCLLFDVGCLMFLLLFDAFSSVLLAVVYVCCVLCVVCCWLMLFWCVLL